MRIWVIVLTLVLGATLAHAERPMMFVYFENYAPYSWQENNQMRGILIDVVNEAVHKRMGVPVAQQGYPWARAQLLVEKGAADAFVTVPTPERKAYAQFGQEPVLRTDFKIFAKAGGSRTRELEKVSSIPELKPFKLTDYLGNGWSKENLKGLNVHWLAAMDYIFPYLYEERADATVQVASVCRYNIKKTGYQNRIVELPNVLSSAPFSLGIGRNSTYSHILPQVDQTIRQMRGDGTLQQIYDKYK
ncbi:MAG: transporter substrate-binding domain-containing protein [Deltaproteobacteria bacterium]|nr:transporter substrate-binding domain-containing protein [Deltaproteobacteria bacterium]